jgi:hypothetical protein
VLTDGQHVRMSAHLGHRLQEFHRMASASPAERKAMASMIAHFRQRR